MQIEELIKMRLSYLKCEILSEDQEILNYLLSKSLNSINNKTNQKYTLTNIPNALVEILVDKTVGEYLFMKKTTDSLTEYDLSPLEKQIQMGDISISYATEGVISPEKRLDAIINFLISGKDKELVRFRRLVW